MKIFKMICKSMWTAIVVLAVGLMFAVACSNDDIDRNNKVTEQQEQQKVEQEQQVQTNNNPIKGDISFILEPGTYKVGKDLGAGEYVLIKNEDEYMGSFDITTGTSGDFDEIVDSNAFHNFEYIKVKDGQYLKLDSCTLYIIDEVKPSMHLEKFDELTNGMFIVGIDIEPGQYKLENINKEYNGWFSLYNSLDGGYNGGVDLQDSDFFDNNTLITLTEGQYLKLDENTKIILNK